MLLHVCSKHQVNDGGAQHLPEALRCILQAPRVEVDICHATWGQSKNSLEVAPL